MSYVVYKYRTIRGKKYGPYAHEVESVRMGDRVVQKHIAYLGKRSGDGYGSQGKKFKVVNDYIFKGNLSAMMKAYNDLPEQVKKDLDAWRKESDPTKFFATDAGKRMFETYGKPLNKDMFRGQNIKFNNKVGDNFSFSDIRGFSGDKSYAQDFGKNVFVVKQGNGKFIPSSPGDKAWYFTSGNYKITNIKSAKDKKYIELE